MSFLSALIGPAIGLVGGLLGDRSQKKATAKQNQFNAEQQEKQNAFDRETAELQREASIEDLAMSLPRLRESAVKAGFNPLTALSVGGAPAYASPASGVASQGVAPKLATPSLIGNAITGFGDQVTSLMARRETQKIAKEQFDEINRQRTLGDVPGTKSVFRNTNTQRRQSAAATVPRTKTPSVGVKPDRAQDATQEAAPISLAPGREVDKMGAVDTGGVFRMENKLTGPEGVIIPGDQEPWGIDELATAAIVGMPQLIYRWGKQAVEATNERVEKIDKRREGKSKENLAPRANYGPPGSRTGF